MEKRTLYLEASENITSTNDVIELFLNDVILEKFKPFLESLYCLNWEQKLFVSSFKNEEIDDDIIATRDVVYHVLKDGLSFQNQNGECLIKLKAREPEPETYKINMFFVNPETTNEMLEGYINNKKWGTLHKIYRHTYSKYKNIENGFITLYMNSYNPNHIPEKCYINGRRITVATPETKNQEKCYTCKKRGHLAKNCKTPKKCNLCNKQGHEEKRCPSNTDKDLQKTNPTYKSMLLKPIEPNPDCQKVVLSADESDVSYHTHTLGDFISPDGKIPPRKTKSRRKNRKSSGKDIGHVKIQDFGNEQVFSGEPSTDIKSLFKDPNRNKKRGISQRSSTNSNENTEMAPSKKSNKTDENSSINYSDSEGNLEIVSEAEDLT